MRSSQLLARLSVDLLLWFCAPAAFLLLYVQHFAAPAAAVLPHLLVVAVLLLGLAVTRMAMARLIPHEAGARWASAVVISMLLGTMLAYYALVLVGLQSWGRVISWELIASYAPQAGQLADAIGISVPLSAGALVLAYAGLLAGTWLYLRRMDWAGPCARGLSPAVLGVLVFAGYVICAMQAEAFAASPRTRQFEPLSLTFFPGDARHHLRGSSIDELSSRNADRLEEMARVDYAGTPAKPGRKNLVLFVVDALRPDHMGVYGYARDTTPNLSRLARTAIAGKPSVMHATCGDSSCGLLSLASSKFVHEFSRRPFTLQQALQRNGYRVHMLLSGDHVNFYKLREVYGEVDSYFDGSAAERHYMNDDRMLTEQLAALPAWDGVPVMIQFHLMSVHILGKRHAPSDAYAPSGSYAFSLKRERERAVNYYDNGVAQADAMIHALLQTLERKGYLQDTVVAVTADHGESLGEHGLYAHANSVREELLRIPFLLFAYGYRPAPAAVERPAHGSQVDIAPTLLAEMDLPIPRTWSGAALQRGPAARTFDYFQQQREVGLVDRRDPASVWKYWIDSQTGTEYAFNLTADPNERANAIASVALDLKREWRLQVISGVSVAPGESLTE
jgi:glucan phosphoethanolaminetransferase (alkaline phosphatase superfamily)